MNAIKSFVSRHQNSTAIAELQFQFDNFDMSLLQMASGSDYTKSSITSDTLLMREASTNLGVIEIDDDELRQLVFNFDFDPATAKFKSIRINSAEPIWLSKRYYFDGICHEDEIIDFFDNIQRHVGFHMEMLMNILIKGGLELQENVKWRVSQDIDYAGTSRDGYSFKTIYKP